MDKEEEESDEDEAFLQSSLDIVNSLSRGDEVTHLTDHLKKPSHSFDSEATDCIYKALKIIAKGSQNNTLTSLTPSPPSSPSPDRLTSTPETKIELNNFACGDYPERNGLCLSPTKQIGNFFGEKEEMRTIMPVVPRLELEFSPTTSIQHTPLPTLREGFGALDVPRLRSRLSEYSRCCHQCHVRKDTLNPVDFLYLFLFGLGTALIFYYLYIPPLYQGPVI